MGYQESWLYIEPQHKFKKLIQAYEKAEQSGYLRVNEKVCRRLKTMFVMNHPGSRTDAVA